MSLVNPGFTFLTERFYNVLRSAAGRARALLHELALARQVSQDELLPVLTANAGSLRELHLRTLYISHLYDNDRLNSTAPFFDAVVAAAPLLQVLTAEEVFCTLKDAPRLLRAEQALAPLQMRDVLTVDCDADTVAGRERFAPFAAAFVDAALQPALLHVRICYADTAQPAVMGALADAALARRLLELRLVYCTPPAAAPLARLLAEGSLTHFGLEDVPAGDTPLFDAAGAALLADALRVNTTLTKLNLSDARLFVDTLAAPLLLGSLVGHRSLRELRIYGNRATTTEGRCTFGAALAALITAEAPALQTLDCGSCALGDVGLAPIVEALSLNRHLRELDVSDNDISEAFARELLLPAVRANTTLLILHAGFFPSEPDAEEAMELVDRC